MEGVEFWPQLQLFDVPFQLDVSRSVEIAKGRFGNMATPHCSRRLEQMALFRLTSSGFDLEMKSAIGRWVGRRRGVTWRRHVSA